MAQVSSPVHPQLFGPRKDVGGYRACCARQEAAAAPYNLGVNLAPKGLGAGLKSHLLRIALPPMGPKQERGTQKFMVGNAHPTR